MDRHSYYTFTTNPADINRLDTLTNGECPSWMQSISWPQEDYARMWGRSRMRWPPRVWEAGRASLRPRLRTPTGGAGVMVRLELLDPQLISRL